MSRYHEMYIFDFVHVIPLVDESVSSHGTFENYFNFSAAFSKKSNLIDWKRRVFKINDDTWRKYVNVDII